MSTKDPKAVVDRRYDLVLLFDVTDGNPNGDPDAGNLPRLDPQTMQGFVTDGCIKRKVRDYVRWAKQGPDGEPEEHYELYIKHGGILANEQKRAFQGAKPSASPNLEARSWMCDNMFDVRAFGAVMSTGKADVKTDDTAKKERKKLWNCGQVRGPVQLTFARSVDPIVPLDITIMRVARTNPDDKTTEVDPDTGEEKAAFAQIGRKSTVPYGLYRGHGFVNPFLAKDTGFTYADLSVFFEALTNMFELDRSASRGLMTTRGIYVFEHESALGNAPAHELFERLRVEPLGAERPPRTFDDYRDRLTLDDRSLPKGVRLYRLPTQHEELFGS